MNMWEFFCTMDYIHFLVESLSTIDKEKIVCPVCGKHEPIVEQRHGGNYGIAYEVRYV